MGVISEALTARVTVDDHGVVTGWNAGAERLLGYPAERIVGRPAAQLLAEPLPQEQVRPLAELPRWHGTLALMRQDGHRLEARVLAYHRTVTRPASPGWLLLSPLTGLSPLPTDEALVTWSFTQSPCCAMALFDTGLRLRRVNGAMEQAHDLTQGDMLGLRNPEINDYLEGEIAEKSMERVLETGLPQYDEFYLRAPGGTREHAWSVYMAPLRDRDGRIHGVSLSAHDMTEQYWARKRLTLIADASKRIGSTLDVTRTAQELVDVAVPELADFVSVELLAALDDVEEPTPQTLPATGPVLLRRIAHQSVIPGAPEAAIAVGELCEYPDDSPPVTCLRSGRAVLYEVTDHAIAEWIKGDSVRASLAREFGIHSVMTVPLAARGTTLGIAIFVRHRHPEVFRRDDLVLAEELAARAAVCVDNARRYTRERGTAVTLQRSLLPQRLPVQQAVEVASRYLPACAHAGVGGDWFDVIPLSGARVALVVGDVVGHGLRASATMGRLRTAVRTLADIDLPPDELLTHLDDLVGRLNMDAEPGSFPDTGYDIGATCLYAVYDPVSHRCSFARAGHPPPVVVSPDGTAALLDLPAGPPLGLGGLPFEAAEIELPEGSLLALYTDGLVETRELDIDIGLRRLRRALSSTAPSLDALCDTVIANLLPQRPADDVALLIARTRGLDAGHVATWDVPAHPSAVAQTRKDAVGKLAVWGLDEAVFVTELVVSELVTNAIRHAEPPIQLRLIHDTSLICEVSDGANTAPHLRRARSFDEGGRGLLLVAQLTDRWGTRQTGTGKTIWAETAL